jgi:hypothetical protein
VKKLEKANCGIMARVLESLITIGQVADLIMQHSARAFLTSTQNPDGGWGYAPDHTSLVEPTAATILALRAHNPGTDMLRSAIDWLRGAQHADGGWGLAQDDQDSGWLTAWAVWALAGTDSANDAVSRGVAFLQQVRPLPTSQDAIQQVSQVLQIDLTLEGWPWWPDEASWVEPTALTLLALSHAPTGESDHARCQTAVDYLLDRRCQPGGWNVGNPVMFSQSLPPRACPTAWVILALAWHDPSAITARDLDALRADMRQDAGVLAHAWGLLALQAVGADEPASRAALRTLRQNDGSWNQNPYHTAIASLALDLGAGT